MSKSLRFFSILLLITCPAAPGFADGAISAEQVVRQYAAAATRGDLEAFLALYSPDIKKYNFPDTLTSSGMEHMRKVYTESFAKKHVKVEIVGMLSLGDTVISRDHVSGLRNGQTAEELAIYQVRDGLIQSIWYVDQVAK